MKTPEIIGGTDWVRTSDLALMKREIMPTGGNFDQHNSGLVGSLIEYRKATRGLTPRGEESLRDMLRFFLTQLSIPTENMTPKDIAQSLGRYADRPYQRHCLYRAITSFYKWLRRTKAVTSNSMDEIDAPKALRGTLEV